MQFFYSYPIKLIFMKKNIALLLFCSITSLSIAQKKINYATVYFEDKTAECTNAKINIDDIVCKDDLIKAKVKITNYTDKTIVIKPEECFFTNPTGNLFSHGKWIIISPRQKESKVFEAKGNDIRTDSIAFKLNGFYICNAVEVTDTKPMPLPPAPEISIGNFRLKLDGWNRGGKEVIIKYKVTYVGDKVGMFVPGKVILKSPEGTECKNKKEEDKTFSFKKNEDFLVEFLFLSDSKKDNTLLWNDAFSESTPEKADNVSIVLKMDVAKTKDKNK